MNLNERELINLLADAEGAGISSTRFGNHPMFWKSAKDCTINNIRGESYLDCTSSYGVMGIGYSNSKVIKAINDAASNITHSMCEIFPTVPYAKVLEKIRSVIGRPNDQVMLTTSGSDAVDVALKLGYRFTRRSGVISFDGSFHGQTLNSLNVTGQSDFRKPFASILPQNVFFAPYPNIYRNPFITNEELIAQTIDKIEKIILSNLETDTAIGSIIIEPMQNAAGYILPPKGFLTELKRLCSKYHVVMIDDEIFTGFGRCGRWLMTDYENVVADIVCVGKSMTGGLPAAACIAPKKIMKSLDYDGMVPLHGSTFTGNALICSAISATIDVITDENLLEKSEDNGKYLRECLNEAFEDANYIGDIRGQGSATMIEFVENRESKKRDPNMARIFSDYLFENHIIGLISALPYANCFALCPPFIIKKHEMNMIINACRTFASKHKGI